MELDYRFLQIDRMTPEMLLKSENLICRNDMICMRLKFRLSVIFYDLKNTRPGKYSDLIVNVRKKIECHKEERKLMFANALTL